MADQPGVYLDNAATTRVDDGVLAAMLPWFSEQYGNAASVYYGLGKAANLAVEQARARLAALIGAGPGEIVFTGGATESDNWVLERHLDPARGKKHFITTAVEHHAVLDTLEYLRKHRGADATLLPVDEYGRVAPAALEQALRDDTALVSVIHANNEVGTMNDVAALAALARTRGVPFHTDATQSAGKIPLDVKALGVDFLSLSAHKFNGPKGAGALYLRKGARLPAWQHGGAQENRRRAGTTNVPALVGLGAAAEAAAQRLADGAEEKRQRAWIEKAWTGLSARIPKLRRNGHPDDRAPNLLSVCVAGAEGEAVLGYLDMYGIQVSSGSACTSGSLEPSHVLLAMGVPVETAHGSVRISIGHHTTDADLDRLLEAMPEVVARLRAMSPTWKE